MNIFVAKLDFGTNEMDLRDLFEQYGAVDSVKIIMDRETGKSKGYGFVEMPDDNEANQAIEELNEAEFQGRYIVVKKARPKEDNRGGGFNRGNRGGGYNRGGGGGGYRNNNNNNW